MTGPGTAPSPADHSRYTAASWPSLLTGSLLLLLALACGGLVDWEAYLSHAKCGLFSKLSYVGLSGWIALVIGWCVPALPLFFRSGQNTQAFYLLEAIVMAVPVGGLAAVLAMPDAVGCNEWSALSVGMLLVPLVSLHVLVVGAGLIVLKIAERGRRRRQAV